MSDLARTPVAQNARQIRNLAAGGVLQRQCACGQHTTAGGECEACKQKREGTLQRAAINPAPVHEVPPIVHEVLRSPGQPLDAGTRAFVEPRFGRDFSQIPVHTKSLASIQAKLTVTYPGDEYEQEADRVTRQVMNTSDAVAANSMQRALSPKEVKDQMRQTKPLAASITPFVQWQMVHNEESEDKEKPVQGKPFAAANKAPLQRQPETEEEEEPIRAKSAGSLADSFKAGDDIETQVSQSKGRGSPLPNSVRAYMEPRFGVDFSDVRVHTGSDALQMNQAVGAQAFTHGSDIYFGAESSPTNLELTAHELTHVVQQADNPPLQTKKREEAVAPPSPEPSGQRICAACAANDKEKKGADPSDRVDASLEAEADSVGALVARGDARRSGVKRIVSKAEGAPIQRFGALEHKTMGDVGAQQQPYRWDITAAEAASGKRDVNYGFELTHGDIVMLSGDLFDAREKDEMGNPIPDNLFELARTPSNNGSVLRSQDEIMYAIYKENPNDIRFKNVCLVPGRKQEDGSPAPTVTFPLMPDPAKPFQPYFSKEVKKAVDMRYLNLAARNREHFVAPEGEKSAGPRSGLFRSAGGSYRAMHETAIGWAFEAGQGGEPIDKAMAYEAAAQHYLTDAFASGHLRTPTGSIKTRWDAIYPNFWESLKGFIVHQMGVHMNKEWNLATIAGTVAAIEDKVRSTLEEKVAAYPALGFERLVALATHDVDNREGLKVVNDLGERWTAYGDSQMKKSDKGESQKFAIKAVALGCQDIRDAYKFPMIVVDPLRALQVDGPGGRKYRAEQKMPPCRSGARVDSVEWLAGQGHRRPLG